MSEIIGTGMVAKAMESLSFDVTVLAAGVSNSTCQMTKEDDVYTREYETLQKVINNKKYKKLVYFSTVTIYQKPKTHYILHKMLMEELISSICPQHLIVRLPNLIGPNQAEWQLIPSLVKQIKQGEVTIQRGAKRCILDVADARMILTCLLHEDKNGRANVFGRPILLEDLVRYISEILEVKPKINFIPAIDYPDLEINFETEDDYYPNILRKYLENKKSS